MQGNAKFAVAVDGSNEKLQQRKQTIDALRQKVRPPLASDLSLHLLSNTHTGVLSRISAARFAPFGLAR